STFRTWIRWRTTASRISRSSWACRASARLPLNVVSKTGTASDPRGDPSAPDGFGPDEDEEEARAARNAARCSTVTVLPVPGPPVTLSRAAVAPPGGDLTLAGMQKRPPGGERVGQDELKFLLARHKRD